MTIICKTCKQPKQREDFYNSKNKSGHSTSCKSCDNIHHYERRRARRLEQGLLVKFPTLANRQLAEEGKKYCPTCKQILDLTEFSTMKVRNGVASHCRKCVVSWSKSYRKTPKCKQKKKEDYQRNKEKWLDKKLRRRFGITLEQYKNTLDKQGCKCIICGRTPEENGKMLAVDHNHETGKNRGLLCSSCNICIGFIEKNKLSILKISEYLKIHNSLNNKDLHGLPSHT